ncbi:glucan 1,3-beta-glucosidase precursor [Spathaspora passalidarum NRRL Y-27907]|uniref:glucan 1,3-beta-glucosidase n=1 Tax=Spathaspora passalidarum (strain NRRL Y-27907 / 11-Y1) TaxID=619300 RepID=G3AF96_SPAPN|nr:glucan 1,3-beta-glucosidase precursor [Spathaspora passalidarum NRRL Y-27907]EGW34884.1 glucan 1,3-beta-glucosidase precursor [Spathaspora passalidarum NRRL Y-27907]
MLLYLRLLVLTTWVVQVLANNSTAFQYKGISIGGWLVLEPYITPTLFKDSLNPGESEDDIPVDEYHYCKKLGKEEAERRLNQHWSEFYNETDFQLIKQAGLNMVRIPIGYWSFEMMDKDPYVSGAQDYLDKAIEWSKQNDLKVLIDLHGAPNTQNGFDNSGLRNIGYPGWQNKTEYVDLTVKILKQIYNKYGTGEFAEKYNDTIIGIEVLNEPYGPALSMNKLKSFYIDTYNDARNIQNFTNSIMFHDAFQGIGDWDDFLSRGKVQVVFNNGTRNITVTKSAKFNNVVLDHHHYEVFADSVHSNITTHLQNIKDYAGSIKKEKNGAIVGEWSAALTDCAMWLNGIGLGTRFEDTAPYGNKTSNGQCAKWTDAKKWSKQQKKDYRRFIEMQLYEYGINTQGWIFWCWKTESATEWDFQALVKYDIMPQPLDNYKYVKNGVDVSGSTKFGLNWVLLISMLVVFL